MSLIRTIKQAALDAIEENDPIKIIYGVVSDTQPLSITINQRLTISSDLILLTSSVLDVTYEISVDEEVEAGGQDLHTHPYVGKKFYAIHKGLNVGDKVLLLREQGGQKYIVLDRLVSEK
jgi:DNA polymerase III sliding clamp (beta) subunit (PCNA family)